MANKRLAWVQMIYCSINLIISSLFFSFMLAFALQRYEWKILWFVVIAAVLPNLLSIYAGYAVLHQKRSRVIGSFLSAGAWLILNALMIKQAINRGPYRGQSEYIFESCFFLLSFTVPLILSMILLWKMKRSKG